MVITNWKPLRRRRESDHDPTIQNLRTIIQARAYQLASTIESDGICGTGSLRPDPQKSTAERDNSLYRLPRYEDKPCRSSNGILSGYLPHGRKHSQTLSMAHSNSHTLGRDDVVCFSFQVCRPQILDKTSHERQRSSVLNSGVRDEQRKLAALQKICQYQSVFSPERNRIEQPGLNLHPGSSNSKSGSVQVSDA